MRVQLSEEAEQEERADAEKLDATEARLRELWRARDALVQQVHAVAAEQKAMFDARGPKQEQLEATHLEHRELGHRLAELRQRRDAARKQLDEAIVAGRLARQELPHGAAIRPELIRRELAQLELRQQTRALPLTEENAMIARIRQLRRELESADRNRVAVQGWQASIRARESAVREARTAVSQFSQELEQARVTREGLMASMRAQLQEVGDLVARIREKARDRGVLMARLDETMGQIRAAEAEARRLVGASRARRDEARRAMAQFGRVRATEAPDRRADTALEELLKRGRVTLG